MVDTDEKKTEEFDLDLVLPAFAQAQGELEKVSKALENDSLTDNITPVDVDLDEQMRLLQEQIDELSARLTQNDEDTEKTDTPPQERVFHPGEELKLDEAEQKTAQQAEPVKETLTADKERLREEKHEKEKEKPEESKKPQTAKTLALAVKETEKKPQEQDKKPAAAEVPKRVMQVKLDRALQPDFTANVQNWTDNPFNRENPAEIIKRQPLAAAPESVKKQVQVPEVKIVEKSVPEVPPEKREVSIPLPAENHDAAPEKAGTREKKREEAPATGSGEKSDVYLSGEDLKFAEKLVKESKKRQHGVAYGAIMALFALLVVIGLALTAAWVWFGNAEGTAHMEELTTQMANQNRQNEKVTLQEMVAAPAYTIKYTMVNDETSNIVIQQYKTDSVLTSDKSRGVAYLEKNGQLYEIDTVAGEAKALEGKPAMYLRYLLLTPERLGKLLSEGSQTAHGQLFRTEDYVGFKAFFADDQLKFIIDSGTGTEYAIREYTKSVETGFDVLPGETPAPTQGSDSQETGVSEESSDEVKLSSMKVEPIDVKLPDNNVVGEVSVGQYLIFD